MKAIIVSKPGGVDQLAFGTAQKPSPGPRQLLIRNRALGINPMDILQREGKYPPPPHASPLLGVDIAGVVEEIGPHVKHFQKGDEVMALLDGGGYAEYSIAAEELTMPIPDSLSFEEAAAIPEVFLTAYQALFLIGEVQPLQWVLVHAGAGGVGTASIQLIKEAEAKAIVTCGSMDKIEACLELGAKGGFNYKAGPFAPKVLEMTDNHGVDLILDFVGQSFWEQNLQSLAQGGAMVHLATLGGSHIPHFDLLTLIKKWATVTGTGLRYRPLDYKARLVKEFSTFALTRFKQKRLRPIISQVLPWSDVRKAHELLKSGATIGKIILTVNHSP